MSTRTTTVRTRQLTRTVPHPQDFSVLSDKKENVNMNGSSGKAKTAKKGAKTYCLCKNADDGSPMIHCSSCKDWYHFRCIDLSERDAEEIQAYVCSSCHEKTGARTISEYLLAHPHSPPAGLVVAPFAAIDVLHTNTILSSRQPAWATICLSLALRNVHIHRLRKIRPRW
ncbi:hypothetical protein LXA43DRAFT_1001195 [Ganoderma leucocontextum]|nr:hypothetical protein LXA43DRAFT_1001195 [Ganoderma leucocontextum]